MELSVTFPTNPDISQTLKSKKVLGESKFTVHQMHCASHRRDYALKLFPISSFGTEQYAKEKSLTNLSHPNIIQHIPFTYHSSEFYGVLTEFAKYGDIFPIVTKGVLNSEVLIRTYFHQIIEGLEYIHSQGFAHLDLKLENLVLGEDFVLKLIDFDQAQPLSETKLKSAGTINYRAPEVLDNNCNDLTAADIYSVGIILFALKFKQLPFAEIQKPEGNHILYYSTFMTANNKFWKMKTKFLEAANSLDEKFIELVNGMLEQDPQKRLKIKDIKDSAWYNGPILSPEALKVEMKNRWTAVMKEKGN